MDRTYESSLKRAFDLAASARAAGQQTIRIEIEPKRRLFGFYVRLWDSAVGKVVGRIATPAYGAERGAFEVDALLIEVGVTDVFEAMRLLKQREFERAQRGPKTLRDRQSGAVAPRISTHR